MSFIDDAEWSDEYGDSNSIAFCDQCAEEIIWMKTKNNKNIPVDPESAIDGDTQFSKAAGHVCHFDTCRTRKEKSVADKFLEGNNIEN